MFVEARRRELGGVDLAVAMAMDNEVVAVDGEVRRSEVVVGESRWKQLPGRRLEMLFCLGIVGFLCVTFGRRRGVVVVMED